MKWLYFGTSETNIFEQDAMQGVKKQVLKCHAKVARCCIGPELGKDYNGLQKHCRVLLIAQIRAMRATLEKR